MRGDVDGRGRAEQRWAAVGRAGKGCRYGEEPSPFGPVYPRQIVMTAWERRLPSVAIDVVTANGFLPEAPRLFDVKPDPIEVAKRQDKRKLSADYVVPPFTTLDARQKSWQDRKRQWLALGIQSEVGRKKGLVYGRFDNPAISAFGSRLVQEQTSVFDPVLCESLCRWFVPNGGLILDPFAGGSVRGIVAAALGYRYLGIDLRAEQVQANIDQADEVFAAHPDARARCRWICGDAAEALRGDAVPDAVDAVITCPPFGDLERYSDDPRDLSAMPADGFEHSYRYILGLAALRLREDRFAAVVVGNIRDRSGHIRDLVGLTASAMSAAGCSVYNEAVLLTPIGTAAVRARPQVDRSRKLVRTHQAVSIFLRGDARRATQALGSDGLALVSCGPDATDEDHYAASLAPCTRPNGDRPAA